MGCSLLRGLIFATPMIKKAAYLLLPVLVAILSICNRTQGDINAFETQNVSIHSVVVKSVPAVRNDLKQNPQDIDRLKIRVKALDDYSALVFQTVFVPSTKVYYSTSSEFFDCNADLVTHSSSGRYLRGPPATA